MPIAEDFFSDLPEVTGRFDAWLAHKKIRDSSYTVYRGMLDRLLNQLGNPCSLAQVPKEALLAFFNEKPLSAMTRHRYLLLFSAFIDTENKRQAASMQRNAARQLLLSQKAPAPEEFDWIQSPAVPKAWELLMDLANSTRWKDVRNAAMMAAMLGAGITSSEAVDLTVDQLFLTGYAVLKIPAAGGAPERIIPAMSPALLHLLQNWLSLRATLSVAHATTRCFIANEKGAAMTPSTVYRIVERTLGGLGPRICPATLRNTFAVEALKTTSAPQVQLWLGHAHLRATLKFEKALSKPGGAANAAA